GRGTSAEVTQGTTVRGVTKSVGKVGTTAKHETPAEGTQGTTAEGVTTTVGKVGATFGGATPAEVTQGTTAEIVTATVGELGTTVGRGTPAEGTQAITAEGVTTSVGEVGTTGGRGTPAEVTQGTTAEGETTTVGELGTTAGHRALLDSTQGTATEDLTITVRKVAASTGHETVAEGTVGETYMPVTVRERNSAISTLSSILSSTTVSSSPLKNISTPHFSTTTSSICEDGIVLIPEEGNSENSLLVPRYFVKPRIPYNPTDVNPGEMGVSFPASDKAYIMIFPVSPAAVIKSVRLPGTSNVDQMRVLFLDAQDKPIIVQPSDHVPLQITSKLEKHPTINVNLLEKVNAVHITFIHTSDSQPPEGVTVEIVACVEPSKTTSKTYTTPATNYTSSISSPDSPCKPKRKPAARVAIGDCISRQEIQQESCAGHCPSYEELDPLTGDIAEKECSCCAPDSTYTEPIIMDCVNPITGRNEERTSQIIRIRSCKCSTCLGTAVKSYSNDEKTYETIDRNNRSKIKTKTRRR
ncbi:unnamed protein product, partial [Rotaria sp. Silwood2]